MGRLDKSVTWGRVVGVMCCLAGTAAGYPAAAAPPRNRTAADLERAWNSRVRDVVWSAGTPVRQALATLAGAQGIAIMLDRRIDPERGIELSLQDVTVADVVEQLAAQCEAVPHTLEAVVYVGPRAATAGLATVAAQRRREARQVPPARAARLTAVRPWGWEELAEPRRLLDELAREADVTVDAGQGLPHDLWPAVDLPPLAWTDRLTLVLAGFGLTFELDGRGQQVRLVPMPTQTRVSGDYPARLTPGARAVLARLFPQAIWDDATGRVRLQDVPEEHARLRRWLERSAARRPRPGGTEKTVMTLRVTQQPVDVILQAITQRLGIAFEVEGDVGTRLQTRVSIDVHDATLDELLAAALEPAGLTFRRRDDAVILSPR